MGKAIGASRQATVSRLAALARMNCSPAAVSARGQGREAAICGAVLDLLNESAYESVTMDAVAARAKASKATIYRRWANKDDLVVDALQRIFGDRSDVLPDTGTLRGDLIGRITQQVDDPALLSAYKAAMKGLAHAADKDPTLVSVIQSSFQQAQLNALQELLDRAHQRGEFVGPVGAALAWEVVHALFSARTTFGTGPVDAEYIKHVVDEVLMPVLTHAGSHPVRTLR